MTGHTWIHISIRTESKYSWGLYPVLCLVWIKMLLGLGTNASMPTVPIPTSRYIANRAMRRLHSTCCCFAPILHLGMSCYQDHRGDTVFLATTSSHILSWPTSLPVLRADILDPPLLLGLPEPEALAGSRAGLTNAWRTSIALLGYHSNYEWSYSE
jgi:hypothetical protein